MLICISVSPVNESVTSLILLVCSVPYRNSSKWVIATRRYFLDRLASCIKPKKIATEEMEFLIHPNAPKYKKIYEPILKPDFATCLQTHIGKLSDITEGVYDYSTFESTFAKEFNIPKRSLKKYLEPNHDYQISDFAKGIVKAYNSKLIDNDNITI